MGIPWLIACMKKIGRKKLGGHTFNLYSLLLACVLKYLKVPSKSKDQQTRAQCELHNTMQTVILLFTFSKTVMANERSS